MLAMTLAWISTPGISAPVTLNTGVRNMSGTALASSVVVVSVRPTSTMLSRSASFQFGDSFRSGSSMRW
jgi:hypothetical protein